ncbi:MAG: hypothetical protein ACK5UG_04035, partial [Synechococcaceae cyanobacterium]
EPAELVAVTPARIGPHLPVAALPALLKTAQDWSLHQGKANVTSAAELLLEHTLIRKKSIMEKH